MASLVVRQLDDDIVRRLKTRASANGCSAEAEHRAILEQALRPKMTGKELWEQLSHGEAAELDLEQSSVDETPEAADLP